MPSDEVTRIVSPKPIQRSTLAAPLTTSQTENITAITIDNIPSFSNFKSFPKLPLELRLMIWKLSLPSGRTIEFSSVIDMRLTGHCVRFNYTLSVNWVLPTPLLHVSRESRSMTLETYELCTGRWKGNPMYINFREDKLKFAKMEDLELTCGTYCLQDYGRSSDEDVVKFQKKIRHIQFDTHYYEAYGALKDMADLETITIDVGSDFMISWRCKNDRTYSEGFDRRREAITKPLVLDSWIGVEGGLWGGSKDRLPILVFSWPRPSRRQKPSSSSIICGF